jgi:hypothetical protein
MPMAESSALAGTTPGKSRRIHPVDSCGPASPACCPPPSLAAPASEFAHHDWPRLGDRCLGGVAGAAHRGSHSRAGHGTYTGDVNLDGQAHAARHAHGIIRGINIAPGAGDAGRDRRLHRQGP